MTVPQKKFHQKVSPELNPNPLCSTGCEAGLMLTQTRSKGVNSNLTQELGG